MDQVKTGLFISALRKEKQMTQEQLGKKLGVTNKTISRWERGNYMPDIEMLALLAGEVEAASLTQTAKSCPGGSPGQDFCWFTAAVPCGRALLSGKSMPPGHALCRAGGQRRAAQ